MNDCENPSTFKDKVTTADEGFYWKRLLFPQLAGLMCGFGNESTVCTGKCFSFMSIGQTERNVIYL
jgi:hypothetical protein